MFHTETWLQEDFLDPLVQVQGFTNVHMDRNINSGKERGGGICVFIKDSWSNNYTMKDTVCTLDLESICLNLRPFYLHKDFRDIFICAVYIPLSGNAFKAASRIADCVHEQVKNEPDASIFVIGDVNRCKLEQAFPGFQQYVKSGTRKNSILDKCCTIKEAYTARIRPPLLNSDHNTIQLIPTFKYAIKRSKPVSKIISVWQDECTKKLSGCFFSTDWEVLYRDNDTDTISDTIVFVSMILYHKRLLGYIQITRTASHQISSSVSDGKRKLSGTVTLWD